MPAKLLPTTTNYELNFAEFMPDEVRGEDFMEEELSSFGGQDFVAGGHLPSLNEFLMDKVGIPDTSLPSHVGYVPTRLSLFEHCINAIPGVVRSENLFPQDTIVELTLDLRLNPQAAEQVENLAAAIVSEPALTLEALQRMEEAETAQAHGW